MELAIGFMKGKSLLTFILKISLSASIYLIWEERNQRCFTGVARTVDDIIRLIREIVKIKITYRGIHILTQVHSSLCIAWGLYRTSFFSRSSRAQASTTTEAMSQSIDKPPYFNGVHYSHWKNRMMIFVQSIDYLLWDVIEDGSTIPMKRIGELQVPKERHEWNNQERKLLE
ncbi:hypothetical protein GQ457_05G025990 [Hibiscus cannabinus]